MMAKFFNIFALDKKDGTPHLQGFFIRNKPQGPSFFKCFNLFKPFVPQPAVVDNASNIVYCA